jgi:hypothetical protein
MPWSNESTPKRLRTLSPYGSAPCPLEPIGTLVIASTPPATIRSAWPEITVAAAKCSAC